MFCHKITTTKRTQYPCIQSNGYGLPFLIWLLMIGAWLFSPIHVSAQSNNTLSLYLTNKTTEQGYTLTYPNNQLRVQITPHSLSRSITAEITQVGTFPDIPKDKDLISDVYQYALLPTTNNTLEKPVVLEMYYPQDETRWREMYIYNEKTQQWEHQKGWINLTDHYLIAETTQASGLIAVFADHLDKSEYLKEQITAPSIYVADAQTGEILIERSSDVVRPIASLSKLATATVFTEHNPGWDTVMRMQPEDDTIPSKIYAKNGSTITTRDLFYATLLKSANNAAKALARSTGMDMSHFAEAMNTATKNIGLEHSTFVEPTGLSEHNISTAEDMYKLAKHAFADPLFLQATTPKHYEIRVAGKPYLLTNTNRLLDVPYTVLGSKTGFTYEAGRCLVMKARNKEGREIIAVTLGGQVPNAHWEDMRMLLDATLGNNQ